MVEFFAKDVDGAILCFDLTCYSTLGNIEAWIDNIQKYKKNIPVIFLGFNTKVKIIKVSLINIYTRNEKIHARTILKNCNRT